TWHKSDVIIAIAGAQNAGLLLPRFLYSPLCHYSLKKIELYPSHLPGLFPVSSLPSLSVLRRCTGWHLLHMQVAANRLGAVTPIYPVTGLYTYPGLPNH